MDPLNFKAIKLYENPSMQSTLAWHPKENKIVISLLKGFMHDELNVLDIATGNLEPITDIEGLNLFPSWRSDGEWIILTTDARHPTHGQDELILLNPVTKEVIYLSGPDGIKPEFRGLHTTWNPLKDDEVALGGTYYGYQSPRPISIYSEIFSDNPGRRRLHTDEQLEKVYPRPSNVYEGNSGVSWSPDGALIAYAVSYFDGYEWRQRIALAAPDGNSTEILPYEYADCPKWSPGGRYLIFIAWGQKTNNKTHLFRLALDGRSLEDLTIKFNPDWMDFDPAWYG